MEVVWLGHALDCQDVGAFYLGGEDQAGACQFAIDENGAHATVAGGASLFRSHQLKLLAKCTQQRLIVVDQKLDLIPVDGAGHVCSHLPSFALDAAIPSALLVRTPAR